MGLPNIIRHVCRAGRLAAGGPVGRCRGEMGRAGDFPGTAEKTGRALAVCGPISGGRRVMVVWIWGAWGRQRLNPLRDTIRWGCVRPVPRAAVPGGRGKRGRPQPDWRGPVPAVLRVALSAERETRPPRFCLSKGQP